MVLVVLCGWFGCRLLLSILLMLLSIVLVFVMIGWCCVCSVMFDMFVMSSVLLSVRFVIMGYGIL